MQKSSGIPRWWDWPAVLMLFILLETVASRLVSTEWTGFLFLTQTATYISYVIGVALGYSKFSPRLTRLISLLYMLIMLPLQWTLVIDQTASLEEQLLSVFGRLYFAFSDFLARRPVEDPFLFVSVVTLAFWLIGSSAGFQLVRRQNYLAAVIPSAIGILVIQSYDNFVEGRVWVLAFYIFLALLLLGRLNYLENKKSWRERRVFLSPDNSIELTSTITITAALIVIFAWAPPASLSSLDSAIRTWNKITRPWRTLTDRMENVVNPLESPSGGRRGEFFGSEIILGRGFPLSDSVMFRVQVPELPSDQRPPRYYWRGRTYDYFVDGQWYTTGTTRAEYSPADNFPAPIFATEDTETARFVFNTGDETFSLIYSPSQPAWISRQGVTFSQTTGSDVEIISWFAQPALIAGEAYQVDAYLNNPDTKQLDEAGTNYPETITAKYLQLPEDFSSDVSRLAREVTATSETPFDKVVAITTYLRSTIEYAEAIPSPPRNRDTLEWILFDYKKGYCVYYATTEVLMLRSLGIPARMAVGFAQGEKDGDEYLVRRYDAHAWPEVYFPGIGWVEFEPTGNQPALSRPLPPRDPSENEDLPGPAISPLINDDLNFAGREPTEEELNAAVPQPIEEPVNINFYLIPSFIILAALTVYFGRKYSVPARIPVALRNTYERNGLQTPSWVMNWEQWVLISPIERYFESINFGLHLLKRPMPVYATPIERAQGLMELLPRVKSEIVTLLDEHQTSLYTSRKADTIRARRAAFRIRWQVILERIRYFIEGKPVENT